jgi:hypothetical protein
MEADAAGVRTNGSVHHHDLKVQVRNEMIRYCAENPLFSLLINVRRLTLAALVILISGVTASTQASANSVAVRQGVRATVVSDNNGPVRLHMGSGNGKQNQVYSAVNSPTVMHGMQQISVSISGKTIIQAAICKKRHRVCNISQKFRTSHANHKHHTR